MIMNTKHIFLTLWAIIGTMALASCNDWLDVEPKSQIKEEKQFSREGGYKDQLTGVYTAMATPQMYGLNMGIGLRSGATPTTASPTSISSSATSTRPTL